MADATVKHAFVSAIPEGTDATKIRTSNWNAALLFTGGNVGEILTRDAGATGAAWTALTKTLVGLPNVENQALSTWAGSGVVNTWTGLQTFNGGAALTGVVTTNINGIATVSTDGLVLQNTTPATAGIPVQRPPRIRLAGQVWKTSGVTNTDEWWIESLPVSAATPVGTLQIRCSLNGAAAVDVLGVDSAGGLWRNAATGSSIGGVATTLVTCPWYRSGGGDNSQILLAASGLLTIIRGTGPVGIGLDVATDAILKIRTRAQSAYAQVDALGYSVGGVAGASKAAGPVTSITVVNGIVTACT